MSNLLSIPFGWIAWFGFVIVFGLFALGVINFDFLKKKKTQQPVEEPISEEPVSIEIEPSTKPTSVKTKKPSTKKTPKMSDKKSTKK
jgi:hypothetical protein